MPDRSATDSLNVRLPLYAYTGALWHGRRVLEIGCGEGASAAYLAGNGATDVVSLDVDAARIERARAQHARPGIHYLLLDDLQQLAALPHRFDVVFLPEGEALLADTGLVTRIRGLLADDGVLVVAVAASERQSAVFRGGVGYYDLADALTRDFRAVRMLGQTPFFGFGLIEFDAGSDGLRVDVSLLGGGTEQPSHYVAIAGGASPPALGQALVQVPFAPIEALAEVAARLQGASATPRDEAALATAEREREHEHEIVRLRAEIAESRLAGQGSASTVELVAAATRADLAERRLDEAERRARVRADEADTRFADLRRKLENALVQSESAVRVSRAQSDEMEELRARLRRAAEDRATSDIEMAKLRRALTEADDSVLTLTRRTAEEMAVVAERLVTGLGSGLNSGIGPGAAVPAAASADIDAKLRGAEALIARGNAEIATLTERLREAETHHARGGLEIAALTERLIEAEARRARSDAESAGLAERLRALDDELRGLKRQAGKIGADIGADIGTGIRTRDDRIANLEGDKQDLLWRVAELEEKLRNAEQDAAEEAAPSEEILSARAARDRAIEEFHRAASAHLNEVSRLQSSVSEHAALVTELEDALGLAEARAVASDREAATLRRNAKDLEESDRARRGRLSELEGKLLRVERERAMGLTQGANGGAELAELTARLQASEQRALTMAERATVAETRAEAAETRAEAAETRAPSATRNGAHALSIPSSEVRSVIEDAEARLRDEVRALGRIEETLGLAEEIIARAPAAAEQAEWERTVAAKDAQIVEGRLELARYKREAETARLHMENELTELRAKIGASGATTGASGSSGTGSDHHLSEQLLLMHSTLGNIRRRAARLRDELEGFRRRIDTLPPGALSSMLEEIGDDLGEFAK